MKDIVLFDGYCNFCSAAVRFIIRRDPGAEFRFAAAQTEAGEGLTVRYGLGELAEHSLILISGDRVFEASDAALRIARKLRGPWPVFYGLIIIPGFIRDFVYRALARYRYRIAGKRSTCFIPDENIRNRFL